MSVHNNQKGNHMHTIIFTIGYAQLTDGFQLLDIATKYGATVIDVRISANSRDPRWRRGALERDLGSHYTWVREFGNKNYKGEFGEGIQLLDPAAGLARIRPLLDAGAVVLLCACGAHQGCHRSVVADYLAAATGQRIEHLYPGRAVQSLAPVAHQTLLF